MTFSWCSESCQNQIATKNTKYATYFIEFLFSVSNENQGSESRPWNPNLAESTKIKKKYRPAEKRRWRDVRHQNSSWTGKKKSKRLTLPHCSFLTYFLSTTCRSCTSSSDHFDTIFIFRFLFTYLYRSLNLSQLNIFTLTTDSFSH